MNTNKHLKIIQRIRTIVAVVAILMAALLFWKIRSSQFTDNSSENSTVKSSVKIVQPQSH
jgi:predicted membrane protein